MFFGLFGVTLAPILAILAIFGFFDREDALAVQGITLMAGNLVSKIAVFRHEMFFPVSFWTLLFVTIS